MQAQKIAELVVKPVTQIYRERLVIQISPSEKEDQIKQYLQIIAKTLEVDKQLNPDQLKKHMSFDTQKSQITVEFGCIELKLLRACVTGFLRHMQLVAKTIEAFGPLA